MRAALLVVLLIATLALPATAPAQAQRGDGLDTPLLSANMCGAGDPHDLHFTFAATGDTFPHENIQAVGEAQGYDVLFDGVRPLLKAADISYTNFDGAMLEGSAYTGYPNFNYNPALAAALKNAGIGLVSTANNHILDRGPEGLDATLDVLERNGILQHGTVRSSESEAPRPPYLPITLSRGGGSLRVAFLSFTWGTNGIADPYNQVNLLWQSNDYGQQSGIRQSVLDDIARARRESDIVVVAAHWGFEYQFYPDDIQIEGARQMAAAGADVILGAQPHTLQPVDVIEANGRRTLVIYSLANFLASQGAFQATSYSATSVIFYVGLVKRADGTAGVTGYRYVPTIHIDNDTRPAPIQAGDSPDVIEYVRLMMRDFSGLRQANPDPAQIGPRVEICPVLDLPGTPGRRIGGDFAQHYATLGSGTTPRPLPDALAVLGTPLGPAVRAPAGDCTTMTDVLSTDLQRLELHSGKDWPYRIVGTQIGVEVYRQRYQAAETQRRIDLEGGAIANEPFRAFFQRYGGLPVFGYPISGELTETDPQTGQPKTVQYFERARFELADPGAAELLGQVRLGALGREFAALNWRCGPQTGAAIEELRQGSGTAEGSRRLQPGTEEAAVDQEHPWWLVPLLVVGVLISFGLLVVGAWNLLFAPIRRGARRRAVARRPRGRAE